MDKFESIDDHEIKPCMYGGPTRNKRKFVGFTIGAAVAIGTGVALSDRFMAEPNICVYGPRPIEDTIYEEYLNDKDSTPTSDVDAIKIINNAVELKTDTIINDSNQNSVEAKKKHPKKKKKRRYRPKPISNNREVMYGPPVRPDKYESYY